MLFAGISHVVGFVDHTCEEVLIENAVDDGGFRSRYVPRASVLWLLLQPGETFVEFFEDSLFHKCSENK